MTRLKYERRQRGYSQTRLAREVGLTQPDLSEIERGIRIPTVAQLEELGLALRLPPADLLKEVIVVQSSEVA